MFFKFDRYTQGSFGQHRVQGTASNTFGSNYRLNRYNTPTDNLAADSILEEWLPKSAQMLNRLFRNIHKFDSIAGPAVDLISIMPFSDVTLIGVEDPKILEVYEQSLAELHIETLLPEIACEYLVIGRVIGSLLFDKTKGIWTDVILQDPDFCDITNIPLRGYDPKIDLKLSEDFKKFLLSKDPRDMTAKRDMPEDFLKLLLSADRLPLDPASTLYLPRKTFPNDYLGSSVYYRVLPFYALEKTLINGTLVGAKRRQRSILHVTVGETDIWEPDEDEISTVAGMFMRADEDPQGAIVATRNGVMTNEVRSGSDFWKLSDEWDFLSNAKMRALGINEAFLAGDATYNCNVFNTLLITEKGILKIGEIANQEIAEAQDISLTVASMSGAEKAIKWIYSGYADTLKLVTDLGNKIEGTPNHPILVFKDNQLYWKMLKDIQCGDSVCASTKVLVRKEMLPLDLIDLPGGKKTLKKPTQMTPELAFLIGCIVSEGSIMPWVVRFSNSNLAFAEKYIECLEKVFGLDRSYIKKVQTALKGDQIEIKGNPCTINQDCYDFIFYSKTIVGWLEQLGLYAGRNQDKSASYYKVVPWAILQADEQSQLAFLASYLEGDGSINSKITYFSASSELLQQMQVMLSSHGLISRKSGTRLALTHVDSLILWPKLKPYMVSKEGAIQSNHKARNRFGFSVEYLKKFLKNRQVKRGTKAGTLFINDSGKQVLVKPWKNVCTSDIRFLYDKFDKGDYNQFLSNLKQISEIEYNKLLILFRLRYFFTEVKSIEDNGKQDVYDISMKKGTEPAFIANGLVVHNTLEAALSIFIESLRNFRDSLVSRIFYEKLFPILAEIHGFKRRTQAELDHRIRIESKAADGSLIIPQLNFHKQLRPEADAAYLEVLGTMEEKGIPVPLRTWASAGGLNLEKILDMEDEDIENRKSVQDWKDKVAKETGGAEPGGGESGEGIPPKEGGAWGSFVNARIEAIRNALGSLPIWVNNKFCGVPRDKFVSIFKSQNPSKKLIALYKNNPKQLEAANYVLHRMGINNLPFNVSATSDVAEFLRRCGTVYSAKKVAGEFTFLNKIIRDSAQNTYPIKTKLPEISKELDLYSGVK